MAYQTNNMARMSGPYSRPEFGNSHGRFVRQAPRTAPAKRKLAERATDPGPRKRRTTENTTRVPKSFITRLASLQQDTLSDFTISCNGRTWPVHRFVLRLHSSFFGKMCTSTFIEGNTARTDLPEDPESAVSAMISYMYTFDYEVADENMEMGELEYHVQIAIIADKYDIPPLQDLASKKFARCLNRRHVEIIAFKYDPEQPQGLVSEKSSFCPDRRYIESVKEIAYVASIAYKFPRPTTVIRASIVDLAIRYPNKFFTGAAEDSAFARLMEVEHALAKDIWTAAVKDETFIRPGEARHRCTRADCGFSFIATCTPESVRINWCVQCTEPLKRLGEPLLREDESESESEDDSEDESD